MIRSLYNCKTECLYTVQPDSEEREFSEGEDGAVEGMGRGRPEIFTEMEGPELELKRKMGFRHIKLSLEGGHKGCSEGRHQIYSGKTVRKNNFSLLCPLLKFMRFQSSQRLWKLLTDIRTSLCFLISEKSLKGEMASRWSQHRKRTGRDEETKSTRPAPDPGSRTKYPQVRPSLGYSTTFFILALPMLHV